MSEEVWYHALQFLDKYSRKVPKEADEKTREFYKYKDDDGQTCSGTSCTINPNSEIAIECEPGTASLDRYVGTAKVPLLPYSPFFGTNWFISSEMSSEQG